MWSGIFWLGRLQSEKLWNSFFFSACLWLGVIKWIMFDYFTGNKDSAHFCSHIWGYVFCLSKDNRGNDCLKHYSLVKLHCKSRYLLPLSSDLLVMQKLTWWIVFPVTVIVKLIDCVPISFVLCWVVFEEVQSGTRVLWGNESMTS